MNNSISYKIAEKAGFKKDSKGLLRPEKHSEIAEKFGHSKDHNQQAYVKHTNKPETSAFICGGSDYTLAEFASCLGYSLDDFRDKEKFELPKQHKNKISLERLSNDYFCYFIDHGIQDPKKLLKSLGIYFTTLENGQYKGNKAFVFPYSNSGFKYFILDDSFKVIDKRTSYKAKETAFPDSNQDTEQDLFIFEGFADCLKARELGYNAFTNTGGVQGTGNIASCFKPLDRTVYLILDQDKASQKALPKVAKAFLDKGHPAKIITLPFEEGQGKDFCDYLQKHSPKEFADLIDKSESFISKSEIFSEETQDIFWYVVQSKKTVDTGEYSYFLKIDQCKLLDFIKKNGFTPMFLLDTNDSIFVRLQENIIEEVNPHKIKEFVLNWVDNLEWDLPEDSTYPKTHFTRKDLRDSLIEAENVYFSKTKLQCIKSVSPNFHRDKRDSAFFYFLNGFVRVTKEGRTFHPYLELDGALWQKHIIQRNFIQNTLDGEYQKFIKNVCNNESERVVALFSAIGYLLHRFKDPANAKAIILVDEKIADTPEGGTGKSLIATAIGKLRNITKIDGKDFDFDNRFAFQDVGLDSDLVIFDDIEIKFKFERLFHKITDGLETERKGQQRIKRSFADSPKYLLTTNYTLQGNGGSAERRKVEYELYNHYSKEFTPRDEFGHNFFDEWDIVEWAKFDSFMMLCVQLFLTHGLKTYKHKNLDQRKIIQETSQEFFEFMDDYFFHIEGVEKREFNNSLMNKQVNISELFESFCSQDPDSKKRMEKGIFTQNKFTKWLKSYAKYSVFKVETGQKRDNERQKRFRWISFSK